VPNRLGARLGRTRVRGENLPLVTRLLTRDVEAPALRPDQRERLVAILGPEADRLRALTGLRTDHWSL
jgi:hypothetical protein